MQSVVLNQMEAFADVTLSSDDQGQWYTPPWYMESLVALSAFVLNCTEVLDNKKTSSSRRGLRRRDSPSLCKPVPAISPTLR
jgi:hypothetical protein